jgi:hypothetical protein
MQLVLACKYLPLFSDYFLDRIEQYAGITLPRDAIARLVEQEFPVTDVDCYPYIDETHITPIVEGINKQLDQSSLAVKRTNVKISADVTPIRIDLDGHLDVTHVTDNLDFSSLVLNNHNIPYVSYTHLIRQRKANFELYDDWYSSNDYAVRIPPAIEHRAHLRQRFEEGVRLIETAANSLLELGIPWVDVYGLLPFGLQVDFREWIRVSDLLNFLRRRVCNREEFPTHTIGQLQYMVAYNVFPQVLEQQGTFPCVERFLADGTYACEEPEAMYERTCAVRGPYVLAEFEEMKAIAKRLPNPWIASESDLSTVRDQALERIGREYTGKDKLVDKIREDSKRNRGY